MAKINKEDITYNIEEVIGVLKENDKNDWAKAVARISWNDRPPTLDIRNMNLSQNKFPPKGISLSDEETDRLTDILLDQDFGSMEALLRAVERKQSRFTITASAIDSFAGEDSDDGMYVIEIKL